MEDTDVNRQLMTFAEKLVGTIFSFPGGFVERAHNAAWKSMEDEVLEIVRPIVEKRAGEATHRLLDEAWLGKVIADQIEVAVRFAVDAKIEELVHQAVERVVASTNVQAIIDQAAFNGIANSLSPGARKQLSTED